MSNSRILVVAAHPDDETLGCGGTLLKHKEAGDEIHWLICTQTNEASNFYKVREKEIHQVSVLYRFDSVRNLKLKTMQIDEYTMTDLISQISDTINDIQPNIIYVPFKSDVHSDHRILFEATYSCTKSFRYPFIKKIYMMETLSETEYSVSLKESAFVPNTFVDITHFLEKKIEIMKVYKSEIGEHPFPRSEKNIRALAIYRGASSGYEYAESFTLLKNRID